MAEGTTHVRLEGACGVERAAEIKEQLLAVLEEDAERVELDLSGVTRADVSLQQIVCSAHRSFFRKGKKMVLSGGPTEAVQRVVQSGGFGSGCYFRRDLCPFQGGSGDE